MLSLTCKASIKAVIFLGTYQDTYKKVSIKEIASYINENEHTVGKLLQKLVKEKIINSSKGPNGGFYVTEEQINQPIIKIIKAIDGDDVFSQCGLGIDECNESKPCPLHQDFKPIRDKFKTMCDEKKLIELYEDVNNGLAHLVK